MKTLLGSTLLVLLTLTVGSGCAPLPVYYSGAPATYRAPVARPAFVSQRVAPVAHRCPGHTHHIRLQNGQWVIHRLTVRTAARQLSNPVPRGTAGAHRTLEPDWGATATQPAELPANQEERLVKMERQLRAVSLATTQIYSDVKEVAKVVRRFKFDDEKPTP